MAESAMPKPCHLQIHINAQQTFLLNEKIMSKYSRRFKKIIIQEKRKCQKKILEIEIDEFPGGPYGFELLSRFCYNNGKIEISASNVTLLYCCALYLEMTEEVTTNNLLQKTETFLEGICHWKWSEILVSLKSCEKFYKYADSYGVLEKLICAVIAKIAQNSDLNLITTSSSSSSSPETNSARRFSSSAKATPETIKSKREWWFDDLTILPPRIVEKLLQSIVAYKADNNNLVLTRFLLHYLKTATQTRGVVCRNSSSEYSGLAETAAYGVIFVGKRKFSCRGLFWVLRIVSGFGLSKDCRFELERLIGGMLDQATLDDLLVSGHGKGVYYDVNLVIRLIGVFVENISNGCEEGVASFQKLKKVGRLIDKYLREIAPDQNLKICKFLGVAECLPDSARDCFDGVYRAIDIYLESHQMISFEERSTLCRCLNYKKLSFESCKDLAKNPRIPPRVAMQALISQQINVTTSKLVIERPRFSLSQIILYNEADTNSFTQDKEDMKLNLERMQWRVVKLEKMCKEIKGQMSRLVGHNMLTNPSRAHARALPRFC